MRIVRLADCPEVPWRNGGGTTRELHLEPDLRVTVAFERTGAAFSDFSGWSRTIVPLGAGFSLRLDEREAVAIPAFQPFSFAGSQRASAALAAGAIEALNVMTRDGALAHRAVRLPLPTTVGDGALRSLICFVARGRVRCGALSLERGTLAVAEDAADRAEFARVNTPPDTILLTFRIDAPDSETRSSVPS